MTRRIAIALLSVSLVSACGPGSVATATKQPTTPGAQLGSSSEGSPTGAQSPGATPAPSGAQRQSCPPLPASTSATTDEQDRLDAVAAQVKALANPGTGYASLLISPPGTVRVFWHGPPPASLGVLTANVQRSGITLTVETAPHTQADIMAAGRRILGARNAGAQIVVVGVCWNGTGVTADVADSTTGQAADTIPEALVQQITELAYPVPVFVRPGLRPGT